MAQPRITGPLVMVLDKLLDSPRDAFYGYDLSKSTGIKSGTLYPLLVRLEEAGWLESGWEQTEVEGRPRRRFYKLTVEGLEGAHGVLRSLPAPKPASNTAPTLRPNLGGAL
ncbi:PadR family transcriptional regulator [Nocardia africana]|uniref:PadR family transcriptional regulator n=1 Tax=Nocardia africana TaxID=134964 RepID=A0ABW6NTP8_9NOCA